MKPTRESLREQFTKTIEAGGLEWVIRKLDVRDIALAFGRLVLTPDASEAGAVRPKRRDELDDETAVAVLSRTVLAGVIVPAKLTDDDVAALPLGLREELSRAILDFAGFSDPFAGKSTAPPESISTGSANDTEEVPTTT